MKAIVIALLYMLMASVMSCNAPKNTYSTDSKESETGGTSKILFLDYQVSRDSISETYEAQLLSMMIREGKIKESRKEDDTTEKGDLELLVLDQNEKTLLHHHIPNPLDKSVEYVNDAGQFEHMMIHLDSAQFSVRLQIEPGASSILLNGFIANETEAKQLLKTPIL